MFDTVIVGGGPAGLTAALYLGRSRRRVLLTDTDEAGNVASSASHGFFTRDGMSPVELRHIGRKQLTAYPSVNVRDVGVRAVKREDDAIILTLETDEIVRGRTFIIASGVHNELPAIDGLAAQWGRGVVHCPYCDGWELRDKRLAVLMNSVTPIERVSLVRNLSQDLVVLTNGTTELSPDVRRRLEADNIQIVTSPITCVEGNDDHLERITFDSGDSIAREALFVLPALHPRNDLAVQLGCDLADNGRMPGMILVDQWRQTSVPGVFAAGDITMPAPHQVTLAVASGAAAAMAVNQILLDEA